MELMKSDRPQPASTSPKDNVGLKGNTDNAVLDFGHNDPLAKFAADDAHDGTRGLKSQEKHGKVSDAPSEKPGQKTSGESSDKSIKSDKSGDNVGDKNGNISTTDGYKILSDTSKLDPNKPTALFLDNFNRGKTIQGLTTDRKSALDQDTIEIPLNSNTAQVSKNHSQETEMGFTHGEFSARMAEKNGYNAIRVQQNDIESQSSLSRFDKSLNGIADKVDSGELKLGKGDVVNVSAGNVDLSFDQVNQLLGSNNDNMITPDNVKNPDTQKDILNRLEANTKDPNLNPALQSFSQQLLDTNKGIQRLQDKGIEVIHAGANKGNDTFSLEFMKADHELASVDPRTGKLDSFSPDHSRTTPANGVYPVRFQPGTEMGGGREGKYTVDGTGVTFGGEEFGNLNLKETVKVGELTTSSQAKLQSFYAETIGRDAPPRVNENGHLVAIAAGNSFDNVDYLARQHDRLVELKRSAN
jgi:hypothetical protein